MKLLNVTKARVIWLFDLLDLNPKGKSIFPDLFEWLVAEYHFKKFPKSVDERDAQGGWILEQGEFQVSEEIFKSVDLGIYNDGLVATTQSTTDDAERFLGNLLDLANKEFSLAFEPPMIRRKMYLSEITVQTSVSLARINPKLQEFANKISSAVGLQGDLGFQVTGIDFATDQIALPLSKMLYSGFIFERKLGATFSENRFYAKAPLPTTKHLELLADLEKLLV
jgi:hypothetical protein